MVTRVAIVNRGEAATRFIKSARLMSPAVEPVLLYVRSDAQSASVRLAPHKALLGEHASAYEDAERVLAVALELGCEAAWLGWGFASERASFVEALEAGGLKVLAPHPHTLALLGDKGRALEVAREVGFETGLASGVNATIELLEGEASELQAHLRALWRAHPDRSNQAWLLKATEGGGGRGIYELSAALLSALDAQPSEAQAAQAAQEAHNELLKRCEEIIEATARARWPLRFVFEPLAEEPLHIEAQLLGDGEGNALVLGLRDCSAQRRRQKLIEECPPPSLPAEVAARLESLALKLAQRVHLRSAATLEALYEPKRGALRFLEVNPRLQVEHPVTEEVYGVDLIQAQLMIARGQGLPPPLPPRGAAVEARVYAEDPARQFAPAPGRLRRFRLPSGPGVRVDTGFEEGDTLSPDFDPLICKVIAWAPTRELALERLACALDELQLLIEGGSANHRYLAALLRSEPMRVGRWHTQRAFEQAPPCPKEREVALISAAIDSFLCSGDLSELDEGRHRQQAERPLDVYRLSSGLFYVQPGDPQQRSAQQQEELREELGGLVEVEVIDADTRAVSLCGERYHVQRCLGDERAWVNGAPHHVPPSSSGLVRAPSMGAVLSIERGVGALVKRGEPLMVLESMKVEVRVEAPHDGALQSLHVEVGALVRPGQPLLSLVSDVPLETSPPPPAFRSKMSVGERAASLIMAACEGWDLPPLSAQARSMGVEALHEARRVELLSAFTDLAELFDRRPRQRAEGVESVSYATRPQLLLSALLDETLSPSGVTLSQEEEREQGASRLAQLVPPAWGELLKRALARLGVHTLRPSHALKEALLRLRRAQDTLLERAEVAEALLTSLSQPPRALLDRLLALDPDRFTALLSLANSCSLSASSREQPEALDERALEAASAQLRDLTAPLWRVPLNPRRLLPELINSALEGDLNSSLSLARALELLEEPLVAQLYSQHTSLTQHVGGVSVTLGELRLLISLTLPPLSELSPWEPPKSSPQQRAPMRWAWLCLHPLGLDAALESSLSDTPELLTSLLSAELPSWREAWLIGLRGARARFERLTPPQREPQREPQRAPTLRSEPTDKDPLSLLLAPLRRDELAVDVSPGRYQRLQLSRFERFKLSRVHSRGALTGALLDPYGRGADLAVALYHLTAYDNPQDMRLFGYAEVGELKRGRGRPLSIPEVDEVFYEALKVMHEALKRLDPQRRLHWNRLVIHLRPLVPLGVEVVKRYMSRLSPRARWLGLEKVIVRARFRDPRAPQGVSPLMDLSVGDLSAAHPSYALRPTSHQALTPRSSFESSVVAARRRGLIHPQDVIYLLESGGGLPRGKVTPLRDLQGERSRERSRDHIREEASQVAVRAYYVETPCARPRVLFKRVLLISDPTLRMGALSVPECELILGAFDEAERLGLPIEWVSVSAGARIDWESGTENLDACAAVLKRIIRFQEAGGQVNVIVPGVCVGAQSYWNAEATMLMSSRGLLIMTDRAAMVLTGKRALELSGCLAARDDLELGGYASVMGPNGQAQLHAPDLPSAYQLLYRFYQLTYRPQGERVPLSKTKDLPHRDLSESPYPKSLGHGFSSLGELFSAEHNRERKRPFSVRPVMQALLDQDAPTLERWGGLEGGEMAVVWHGRLQGRAVTLIGIDNQALHRATRAAEGPQSWSGGTLYPQASRKIARAINASRGGCPVVILANLSGFDGSPESLRSWQLEYGAEIARAVVAFDQPLYFVVLSRYHGGAYVVFSKALNPRLEVIALEGSFASVIGGGPAASIVFSRELNAMAEAQGGKASDYLKAHASLAQRFDQTHNIERAQAVGSIDTILKLPALRAHLVEALARHEEAPP